MLAVSPHKHPLLRPHIPPTQSDFGAAGDRDEAPVPLDQYQDRGSDRAAERRLDLVLSPAPSDHEAQSQRPYCPQSPAHKPPSSVMMNPAAEGGVKPGAAEGRCGTMSLAPTDVKSRTGSAGPKGDTI